ncbi:MAG: carboxypeptidase regulatory-like domain-containing protein [Bryobacteraceae bacterium]
MLAKLIGSLILTVPLAFAQFGSGIQGTVADRSGGVLVGAKVRVVNADTGIARDTLTSGAGGYRLLSLNPGQYTIQVEKEGFSAAEQKGVSVSADEIRKVDFTLTVGSVAEKVTVEAQATQLETEQGRISGTINATQLKSLPAASRNVYNLLSLQPGVTGRPFASDVYEGEPAPTVRASGQRSEANYFTVDDESINSISRGGTVNMTPNMDSVAEVRVVSHSFSAENGRNSGAQIQISSKSGSNQFHGSASEFFQNNTLSSRNIFESAVPVNRQNQFGFTFGGPIRKNRTFFFGSYEGVRRSGARAVVATVETKELRDFVIRNRPNTIAAKLLGQYPSIADPTTGFRDLGSPARGVNVLGPADGIMDIGSVTFVPNSKRTGDQFNVRIDHELRPGKDRLYGNFYRTHGYSRTTDLRPYFARPQDDTSHFGNVNHTHIFGPASLNELRLGVIRLHGQPASPALQEVPQITITGSAGYQSVSNFPGGWFQTSYNLKDTFSRVQGNHSLKIGGELRRMHNNLRNTAAFIPVYTFANLLDFVDDEPIQMTRNVDPRTGNPVATDNAIRVWEGGLFIQDDWKARRNLTFNLGLRWEYYGPITDANNRLRSFIWGSGANYAERLASGKVDVVPSMWTAPKGNFGPRFGFAWDMAGKGVTVLRGGYGISYDRLATVVPGGYRNNPPLSATATLGLFFGTPFTYSLGDTSKPFLGYPVDPGLRVGLDERNGIRGSRVSVVAVDPGFKSPYAHDWFLGIQRALPMRLVLELGYLGTAGHHLINVVNPNRYAGDLRDNRFDGYNPSFSGISSSQSVSNSIYHGGTVTLKRPFARGFTVQGAYTYGKVITDAETAQGETLYGDAANRRPFRSVASFDVPQRLAMFGVWELPWLKSCESIACRTIGGWELSGSSVLEKGLPFSVFTTAAWPRGDFNADGTNYDFPNAPADSVKRGKFTRAELLSGIFPVSAFPLPTGGTLGNLGRNVFRGPGFARVDLSLAKTFRATERMGVTMRMEAFNALNRVNLNAPVSDLNSNNFGRVTSAQAPRQFQGSLQIRF